MTYALLVESGGGAPVLEVMDALDAFLVPEPEPDPATWGESPEALANQRRAEELAGPARPRVPLPD